MVTFFLLADFFIVACLILHLLHPDTYFSHFKCFIYFIYSAFILTTLIGISGGIDVYKRIIGCKWKLPQRQSKVDEIDRKQKELTDLKNAINIAWIPGQHASFYFSFFKNSETHLKCLTLIWVSFLVVCFKKVVMVTLFFPLSRTMLGIC